MAKYYINYWVSGTYSVNVEADTEEEALEKANEEMCSINLFDLNDPEWDEPLDVIKEE